MGRTLMLLLCLLCSATAAWCTLEGFFNDGPVRSYRDKDKTVFVRFNNKYEAFFNYDAQDTLIVDTDYIMEGNRLGDWLMNVESDPTWFSHEWLSYIMERGE